MKSSARTTRDTLVQNLFENMNALKRGMSAHLQQLNGNCPIPHSQLELLFVIRQSQPISFKQLATTLYLTPGAISQLAEGLEQHELISRQIDDKDRRVQCLQVSKKGNKLLQTIEKRRRTFMESVIEGLTDDELAVWLRVQDKMLHQLQADTTEHHKKETK